MTAAKKKTTKGAKAKTSRSSSKRSTPAKANKKTKATSKPDDEPRHPWIRRSALQEVSAIILLGFGIFILLSLVSNLQVGGDSEGNLCGDLGHRISDKLILATGVFSFAVPAVLFAWGLMVLLEKRISHFGARALAAFVLLLSLATLGNFLLPSTSPRGGGIGAYLQATLENRLSTLGSLVLLTTIILAATVVATDWLLVSLISRAVTAIRRRFVPALAGADASLTAAPSSASTTKKSPSRRSKVREVEEEPEENEAPTRGKAKSKDKENVRGSKSKKDAEKSKKTKEKRGATNPLLPDGSDFEEPSETEFSSAKKSKAESQKAKKGENKGAESKELPSKKPVEEEGFVSQATEESTRKTPVRIRQPQPKPNREKESASGATSGEVVEGDYVFPPLDLLEPVRSDRVAETPEEIRRKSLILEHTLKNFKIQAEVVEICKGPVITQYELELAAGIKVSRIASFSDDLAMALAAESVRIVAPIPGKSTVGIEVPNTYRELVTIRELFEDPEFRRTSHAIPLMLGRDAAGRPIIEDLAQMPHVLIAGATGSGKSVCINSIILSVLLSRSPQDVEMILIDPKMVELSQFAKVPHLLTPVVTDMKRAPFILEWAVQKMEERYELLAAVGVRNIGSFNGLSPEEIRERLQIEEDPEEPPSDEQIVTHLPYIVIVVDELADLMMTASKEVETSITRLCQKSRAVGIHIILATQRPSVDVITGLIKSNMPARISFKVASKVDSRTILDRNGAEKLLGQGDMLYLPPRTSELSRAQGTFLDDKEIRRVTQHLKKTSTPSFNSELSTVGSPGNADGATKDDLYEAAVRIILDSQRGSVSLLQRQLGVGYTRAARLIDLMAKDGLVGKYKGSQAREVLISLEEWDEAQESKLEKKTR